MKVTAIIPALDEAATIGDVVRSLPREHVQHVIVVDNGSRDGTAEVARAAGAQVVVEPERGYGAACLRGLASLPPDTEAVLFLDADGSDDPAAITQVLEALISGRCDLVVGSRRAGEPGALTLPQRLGNGLAALWLRARFDMHATDLGPLRAISTSALDRLDMQDRNYGWTIEMQIKAARLGLRYREVRVRARRRRAGKSKVSGTLRGTVGAGLKILGLLAWHDFVTPRLARPQKAPGEGS